MALRLGSVLSARDFPAAELAALVLDGEAYPLDECVSSIDVPTSASQRAAALALELPNRLIAEQHTAAWVWGVIPQPPAQHEVCADLTARARPPLDARFTVREVVILHEDMVVLSGAAITSPMRTAIDLARFVSDWNADERRIVTELMAMAGCGILDCARVMNRRRNLPNKRIALERLAECE